LNLRSSLFYSTVYNKETLGFRLDSKQEISVFRDHAESVHNQIKDIFDYTWALVSTMIEAQQSSHLHSDDWQRTVYINGLGVQTTDFTLSDKTKKTSSIWHRWHDQIF